MKKHTRINLTISPFSYTKSLLKSLSLMSFSSSSSLLIRRKLYSLSGPVRSHSAPSMGDVKGEKMERFLKFCIGNSSSTLETSVVSSRELTNFRDLLNKFRNMASQNEQQKRRAILVFELHSKRVYYQAKFEREKRKLNRNQVTEPPVEHEIYTESKNWNFSFSKIFQTLVLLKSNFSYIKAGECFRIFQSEKYI